MLPLDDYARDEATDSVSENSRDQVGPSICYRDLGRNLEVQRYGEHHLDTISAFNHRVLRQV